MTVCCTKTCVILSKLCNQLLQQTICVQCKLGDILCILRAITIYKFLIFIYLATSVFQYNTIYTQQYFSSKYHNPQKKQFYISSVQFNISSTTVNSYLYPAVKQFSFISSESEIHSLNHIHSNNPFSILVFAKPETPNVSFGNRRNFSIINPFTVIRNKHRISYNPSLFVS